MQISARGAGLRLPAVTPRQRAGEAARLATGSSGTANLSNLLTMTGRARWLRASEACAELGIDEPQLVRMIDHGKIPGYRIGRHVQLRRVDVERAAYLLDLECGAC